MQNIEDLAREYQIAKATKLAANEAFDKAENALCQELLVKKDKTLVVGVNNTPYRVTVIQKETPTIDADGLKTEIGALAFRKVCVPKVNAKLVEAAVKNGVLSIGAVSKYITYTKSKPYISMNLADEK